MTDLWAVLAVVMLGVAGWRLWNTARKDYAVVNLLQHLQLEGGSAISSRAVRSVALDTALSLASLTLFLVGIWILVQHFVS